MKFISKFLSLLLLVTVFSCTNKEKNSEKFQNRRNKIVNVRDKVKEIEVEDVILSGKTRPYIINDYLIISDFKAANKIIHLFDKKDFKYLTSTGYVGQGPDEITIMGCIGLDEKNRKFYVTDHGKNQVFSYALDSVLINPFYTPEVKLKLDPKQFMDKYQYFNETLSIGRIIEPTGNQGFKQKTAKWNMKTGEIVLMKYEHSAINKKRINVAANEKEGLYVECYTYKDLITICDFNGNLLYNIYGPSWDDSETNKTQYFGEVAFCGNKIITSYSGKDTFDKYNQATEFIVLDLNGDYIKTLNIGYNIESFCYDSENNRIIMSLNDDLQFGYLDLDGII